MPEPQTGFNQQTGVMQVAFSLQQTYQNSSATMHLLLANQIKKT